MKGIFFKALLTTLVLAMSSCKLNYLPESAVGDDAYYKNANEVVSALIGSYSGLIPIYDEMWRFTEIRSDNAHMSTTGTSAANNEEIRKFDFYQQTGQDKTLYEMLFRPAYKTIYRCNKVLSSLSVIADADLRAKVRSEALFIRSMLYFDLVRLFGETWLVTNLISGEQALKMSKSSITVIYKQITDDLESIIKPEGKLPYPSFASGTPKQPSAEIGRATIYSARALLAKVYLTQKNYSGVKSVLKPVVDDYGTAQLVEFDKVFSTSNEMNKEILFAVRYKAGGLGLGSSLVNYFAALNSQADLVIGNGMGHNSPADGLIEAYGNTSKWVGSNGEEWTPGAIFKPNEIESVTRPTGEGIDKRNAKSIAFYVKGSMWWASKYWEGKDVVKTLNDAETDWPAIRYADVLLMYAEAFNDGDDDQTNAAIYVDAVRTRAGLAGLDAAAKSDKTTMHAAILLERRLEFAFENQRYYDMLREGNAYVVSTINTQFITEPFYLSYSNNAPTPISESDIALPIPIDMTKLY